MNAKHQSTTSVDLSIVIPSWNEAHRLPATLKRIHAFQEAVGTHLEVIVADDGSSDDTCQAALSACQGLQVKVLSAGGRRGPGHAVKRGVLAAKGNYILISDADGPVPFEDTMVLWDALRAGADFAAGSRVKDPRSVLQPQPYHRIVMGKVWRRVTQAIVPTGIQDTQCGFKLMKRQCAHSIFQALESNGFGFHVEALFLAHQQGFKVEEHPVRWKDVGGSKVNLIKDPLVMLGEIFKIAARAKWSVRRTSELNQ